MTLKAHVNSPPYVIAFAAIVSLVFTGAILGLQSLSDETARRNARLFEQRALLDVFGLGGPGMSDGQVIEAYARHIRVRPGAVTDPTSGASFQVIEAWGPAETARASGTTRPGGQGADERLVGYAFPMGGVGFWARISGYLAVTPDLTRTMGIAFLQHSETPGLGGRITEARWREQFRGLDITPPRAGGKVLYIGGETPAGADSPRHGRHVDAITGATGTSTAVAAFLNPRIAEFRRAAEAGGLVRPAAGKGRNDG